MTHPDITPLPRLPVSAGASTTKRRAPSRQRRRTAPRSPADAISARATDVGAIESRLESSLARANIHVAASRRRDLARYVALLARWNRAYNLTAVRDPFAMVDRHVVDSLTALPFLVGTRLLDVGTGAGLPGIVLAIVRPDVRCALLDPVRKKTRFCAHAAMTLGLENVEVASERLAQHQPPHRFQTIISRATLTVSDLVSGALSLLDDPGRIIAMKGPEPEPELDALDRGGLAVRVEPVPGGSARAGTTLVLIERARRGDGVTVYGDVTMG